MCAAPRISMLRRDGDIHCLQPSMFRSCLRQLVAFLVLPNLLYWVLRSYALEISGHGLIDISYLVIGAAALYWRKWIVLPLLTLVVVADLCDTVAAAFHLRNTGLASVARFVLFPSRSYMLLSSVLLIGWIAAVVGLIWVVRVWRQRPERRMVALVCLAVAAGLMIANSLSGYGLIVNHHWTARNFRVIP